MAKKKNPQPREVQSLQTFKDPSEVVAINTVKLTEVQLKTWLAMLYYARESFRAETHLIRVEELNELSGYSGKNIKHLKESMTTFCQTVVGFNTLGKSKKSYGGVITSLLAGANFDKHPGFVEFAFSPMLKDIVENSNMFANLSLALVRNLETKAGLSLYRVMNDYRGVRTTPEIPLSDLRKILGVDEGEYPAFKKLNAQILGPACKQVNEKTDLKITPYFFRGAHGKVLSVKFDIQEQKMPLLVKSKSLGDQKNDEKKRKETKNPYGHLTDIEIYSALKRIQEEIESSNAFSPKLIAEKSALKNLAESRGLETP